MLRILRRSHHRFRPISTLSGATTTSASNSINPSTLSDLVSRQYWSHLDALISAVAAASAATPADAAIFVLLHLLDCPSSSGTALRFSRWFRSRYRITLDLPSTAASFSLSPRTSTTSRYVPSSTLLPDPNLTPLSPSSTSSLSPPSLPVVDMTPFP